MTEIDGDSGSSNFQLMLMERRWENGILTMPYVRLVQITMSEFVFFPLPVAPAILVQNV